MTTSPTKPAVYKYRDLFRTHFILRFNKRGSDFNRVECLVERFRDGLR